MSSSFATSWTITHQAPLSMGFPRQEYWSGLPFPSPGDLPDPGIEPASPALADGFFTTDPSGKPRLAVHSLSPVLLSAAPWAAGSREALMLTLSHSMWGLVP